MNQCVDIGCNDGTLLNSYDGSLTLRKVGFEPSTNAAAIARQFDIDVREQFFGEPDTQLSDLVGRADVVTSIAMFYDLEEPRRFVESVRDILKTTGVWVLEMSYLPSMLRTTSVDTICHEHLEYYSLRQIDWMLNPLGLMVLDVSLNTVNGGSFQIVVGKAEYWSSRCATIPKVEGFRQREAALELGDSATYQRFAKRCGVFRSDLLEMVGRFTSETSVIAGYGASTKGNTLLQYCGIGPKELPYIADRNPWKFGRLTPGSGIPIVSEEFFRAETPSAALVLPWHFIAGFVEREHQYLAQGGRFIVPLPHIRVLGEQAIGP
jgi:NDP-4-keto-2,6-dideoxyhexose 3-C-methyltransferase